MRVKHNKFLITAAHSGLKRLMEQLIEKYRDADWIFWSNVWELVDQSKMTAKQACFADIVSDITQQDPYHINGEIVDFRKAGRFHDNNIGDYRFTGESIRMGGFWEYLIRMQDIDRIDALKEWLREFREIVIPKVNEIIESYEEKEPQLTEKELKDRKKKYRAYEQALTDYQKLLEKSMDVIEFMELDPRLHP